VVDLRAVNPLNYDKLVASVNRTGKAVLACDSVERGSVMRNVAANLTQLAFDSLGAPPVVIGFRNWISPGAELESMFFPQAEWILDAVHEKIMPLQGHTPTSRQTTNFSYIKMIKLLRDKK
jgi:2-oxoisovalerate dehydrogenase E1 component